MASRKKANNSTQNLPSSANQRAQMPTIPQIVLDEGTEISTNPSTTRPSSPSATSSSARTWNQQAGYTDSSPTRSGTSDHPSGPRVNRYQIPVRSSSDIGLPATSMPNLAIQIGVGVSESGNENHLGVYCSPRSSRRSVDLDSNSKEETRGQYEWIETLDSSSNSLKVLTASSRVGSALSLNSECTTRSIGLLSNDSDSDDLSLSEKDRPLDKPPSAQLRRYLSYPEESPNPDTSTRPSQSLCNLKQVDTSSHERALRTGKSLDCSLLDRRSDPKYAYSSNHSSDTPSSQQSEQELALSVECLSKNIDDSVDDKEMESVKRRLNTVGIRKPSGFKKSDNMLCYKCDANASSRDGRIRQWLQDMDRHDYAD